MAEKRFIPNVKLEGTRILFRNFAGAANRMNAKGNRNFNVVLTQELAEEMEQDGWNVKYLAPREEGEMPLPILKVKVSFDVKPPRIVMVTSRGRTQLGEDEVSLLDAAEIENVDLIVNPYRWTDDDNVEHITAYVKSLYVKIREDELELKYADVPDTGAMASRDWEE
jgi:hypothetical protein